LAFAGLLAAGFGGAVAEGGFGYSLAFSYSFFCFLASPSAFIFSLSSFIFAAFSSFWRCSSGVGPAGG